MRPHQWVKNVFVLAPLVFAERALVLEDFMVAAAAFMLFSMLSGCVYILNDIVDVAGDQAHPTKRLRPIASGALPLATAKVALAGILVTTLAVSAWISPVFALIGLGYFSLNVAYSLVLKHVPFIDVGCIASGFMLRLIGGAVAIAAPVTIWILGATFFLASFLGLGKRKQELIQAGTAAGKQRRVLARYQLGHVRLAMTVVAALTVLTYVAYTIFGAHVGRLFHPRELAWTIPCVLYGVWRFNQLTNRGDQGQSPTDLMLSDTLFLLNLAVYGAVVIVVIYL
jgi:decaprenyl-phosphate phosphoribosyltransferase